VLCIEVLSRGRRGSTGNVPDPIGRDGIRQVMPLPSPASLYKDAAWPIDADFGCLWVS